MTIGEPSVCANCVRLSGRSGDADGVLTGTCAAYPVGIPLDLFAGGASHDELRGDEVEPVTFKPWEVSVPQ